MSFNIRGTKALGPTDKNCTEIIRSHSSVKSYCTYDRGQFALDCFKMSCTISLLQLNTHEQGYENYTGLVILRFFTKVLWLTYSETKGEDTVLFSAAEGIADEAV